MSRTPRSSASRRERSLTETLLSIVLAMEAAVLFFATLVVFGLRILEPVPAFLGGSVAILILGILAGLQRYRWGIAAGAAAQLCLVALGILVPAMFLVGAGFAAFWLWCYLRGGRIDRARTENLPVVQGRSASLDTTGADSAGAAAEGEAP